MKYPSYYSELIKMVESDQAEVKSFSRDYSSMSKDEISRRKADLLLHSKARAKRVLEIINEIGLPTIEAIGYEGSQALSLIALHSTYSTMKIVLDIYMKAFLAHPNSIYPEAIPPLIDRVRIIEGKKQLYGTQWLLGEDGQPFLYPIENFKEVSNRRAKFGLGTLKRPTNLAISTQSQKQIPARKSDQRKSTEQEYVDYVRDFID